ncbi:DMT family transporter [Frigidibacter sp. MR17.24]|uniref:DMT family transporter n=1 Tax=Frigidibacter sp. MR17.24 TaxID=3127345 RepID=UPI003012C98E
MPSLSLSRSLSRSLSPTAQGILTMLLGLVFYTLMDAMAKHLGERYASLQVVWARYAVQTALLMVLFAPRLGQVLRTRAPGLQAARSVFQFGATALFFGALPFVGLAEATAIMDVNPVLITLGAALVLGERLGPRRIVGIALALTGALIVIRPGSGVFTPAALMPLAAAVCYASFAVLTRRLGSRDPVPTSLIYAGLFGTLASTALLPAVWQPVAAADLPGFVIVGLLGAAGQLCLIRAFTMAEAGALAPFGYTGLILAAVWSWLFWDRLPDVQTFVGMVVIAGAGLYVWHRETRADRRAGMTGAKAPPPRPDP